MRPGSVNQNLGLAGCVMRYCAIIRVEKKREEQLALLAPSEKRGS